MIDSVFKNAVNWMSVANTFIQFVASVAAIATIIYLYICDYRPIIKLLKPLGITNRLIFMSVFHCRKNPRKHIRVFCEYMLIKSEGHYRTKRWWGKSYQNFLAFFNDSDRDNFIIEIDNCTYILDDEISERIDQYFNYFDSKYNRKIFKISSIVPISFCSSIKFSQGFLSPNFLLTGLMSSYKNNWENLIKKYISLSCSLSADDSNYSSGLYYTFAWLLWGPSFKIKNQENHFKLCQYAFGDENNSINVILNNDNDELWNAINNHLNGLLCSLTCKLYKANKYVDFYREKFNPTNAYFTNKVSEEETTFLLESTSYRMRNDYKASNYYCTAYVWIMFEEQLSNNRYFSPQNTVTFFEHANIANHTNYNFCIDSLISKCFLYFDGIFSDPSCNKKFTLSLTMNEFIENQFKDKFKLKIADDSDLSKKYKNSLLLKKKHSESVILNAFDQVFLGEDNMYEIVEVKLNDAKSLTMLGEFYMSIYINSFRDINERECLDNMLNYLKKSNDDLNNNYYYHILIIKKQGEVVGGIIFDYFITSNSGVIEFICVKSGRESEGIGTILYNKSIEYLMADAKASHKNLDYIFCETEKKETLKNGASENYLYFWSKLGFRRAQFRYIQPAIDIDKESVDTLDLVLLSINPINNTDSILFDKLQCFIYDYAKYAMNIEQPDKNPYIKEMGRNVESKGISLTKII
jgi:ribosomal protein S18 acetylase RimI-like enzyme